MDREVECNDRLRILKNLSILIKTSTSELLFLKKYSPYSGIEFLTARNWNVENRGFNK